jgi:hypothetical protein
MRGRYKDTSDVSKLVLTETKIITPQVAGGYRLGKLETNYTQFNMTHKPNWFHRQTMRIFFGWYWFDNDVK